MQLFGGFCQAGLPHNLFGLKKGKNCLPPRPKRAKICPMTKKPARSTADKRAASVSAGLDDLEAWLRDLAQRGLSAFTAKDWEMVAARLTDAKAGEMARHIRIALNDIHKATPTVANERLMAEAGRLWLLVQAYRRIDSLPPGLAADVRTAIGWAEDQKALAERPGLQDRWWVGGIVYEVVEKTLKMRRTWLVGQQTGRYACLIDYKFGAQAYKAYYPANTCIDGELVYFPSATPTRAILKIPYGPPTFRPEVALPKVAATFRDALQTYAAALGENPFLRGWPFAIRDVIFNDAAAPKQWTVHDADGMGVPLAQGLGMRGWQLMAASGGHPVTLLGEWDGSQLWPLSIERQGKWVCLDYD